MHSPSPPSPSGRTTTKTSKSQSDPCAKKYSCYSSYYFPSLSGPTANLVFKKSRVKNPRDPCAFRKTERNSCSRKKSPPKPNLIKIKSLPLHIVSYPLTPKRPQAPAVTIAIHSKSKLTKGYNMGNTQLSTRQKQSLTAIATADIK